MSQISENVKQVLSTLVSASVVNDIVCFVFYDQHPRDQKNIDITVCTVYGEVREYYQRDLVSSLRLDTTHQPSEISIFRNTNCELFYLVEANDELLILSRGDTLVSYKKVTNVERFDISDLTCTGQPLLRIVLKDDAVPLIFDDKLDNFQSNMDTSFRKEDSDGSLPIVTHLMRKLTEARYSVQHNEKTLKDLLDIHQKVGYEACKRNCPGVAEATFKGGTKEFAQALNIDTHSPWIKMCNSKIVIVFNVDNQNQESLEQVNVCLHGTTNKSIEYTTKIFEEIHTAPYWVEKCDQTVIPNTKTSIVVVIKLEELKDSVISRIEFDGAIFYKKLGKEYLLPIEDVKLSSLNTMGQEFDVLCNDIKDKDSLLSILATTEKIDLVLRHIKTNTHEDLSINIFIKYLKMERVLDTNDIVIHKRSPYHILNGVMVKWNSGTEFERNTNSITVYSRAPSQVLALIHYTTDAVPQTIVITTPDYKITAKHDDLSRYNEDLLCPTQLIPNYSSYVPSMLNRSKFILQYLDNSMIKMSESKYTVIQNKIGSEIDLFAGGDKMFAEFKEKMRGEAATGVNMLLKDGLKEDLVVHSGTDDVMFID